MSDEETYTTGSDSEQSSDVEYVGSDDTASSDDENLDEVADPDMDDGEEEEAKAMATQEPPMVSPTPSDPEDPLIPASKLLNAKVVIVRPKNLKDQNPGEHVVFANSAAFARSNVRVYDPAQLRNTPNDPDGLVLVASKDHPRQKHWGFVVPKRNQSCPEAVESYRAGSPIDVVLMTKSAEIKRLKSVFGSTVEPTSTKGTKFDKRLQELIFKSSDPLNVVASDAATKELRKCYPNAMKKLCVPLLSYSSWKTEVKPPAQTPTENTPDLKPKPKPKLKPKPKPKPNQLTVKRPEPSVKPGPSPVKPRKRPPPPNEEKLVQVPKRLCVEPTPSVKETIDVQVTFTVRGAEHARATELAKVLSSVMHQSAAN
ncbi:MAG: hypothetical protein ACPGR8_01125 [Limisphaerales bacterium]